MRIIAKLEDENLAVRLSSYLQANEVENTTELSSDPETSKPLTLIWVHDEDKIDKALSLYEQFSKDPDAYKELEVPIGEQTEKNEKEVIENIQKQLPLAKKRPTLTMVFFIICASIYLVNLLQVGFTNKEQALFSPIQLALIYDVPKSVEMLNELYQKTNFDLKAELKDLPPTVTQEVAKIQNIPTWRGLYYLFLPSEENGSKTTTYPPFTKIRQGEFWRVLSPSFLHLGFLHIAFNMIWLWVLGIEIERRLSIFKYLILVIFIGIFSNTCQYLMAGPLFMGFSGVVVGLAGFIWSRQKVAPWEGHRIHKSTFIFLTFYVLLMMGIQVLSYFMQVFGSEGLPGYLANTAHVSGGILGLILGRAPFFSWSRS